MASGPKARIAANLATVRQRIAESLARSGRSDQDVKIIAVTKSAELDAIRALVELGHTDLGESRAIQLAERAEQLQATGGAAVQWHMVGHLQRNKVRPVLEAGAVIHSVDSLRLAEELNHRCEQMGIVSDVLLQVNCSQESQKFGVAVGAAVHLPELICTLRQLRLVGLMTMAAIDGGTDAARRSFGRLRELLEDVRHEGIGGEAMRHLSMGMSQDYPIAVEEGATIIRIGTALFQ